MASGCPPTSNDAIADPEVQAILLATPHSLHVEQVRMVAAAGKPVWCEKPLALTRAQAERAVAAVRAAGVPLGSGNNKRCFASMRELKRVVDSGAIGKILHIEGHFSNEHSTRVVRRLARRSEGIAGRRHDRRRPARARCLRQSRRADQLCRRAQHRQEAAARPARRGRRAGGVRQWRNRCHGTVRAAPVFWRCHVFGTDGSAEARGEDTLIVGKIGGPTEEKTYPHVDSLRTLLEAFADAIEGKAPFPVRPEQMLDVIGAFEAVIASLAKGAPVKLR